MRIAVALVALLALGACAPTEPTAVPRGPKRPPIVLGTPAPAASPGALIVKPPGIPSETPAGDGDCPPETLRGWAFYNAVWPGGACFGSGPCGAVNAGGGFPRDVSINFDSTGHPQKGQPMPNHCKVPATTWSISPHVQLDTNHSEPFAMHATFTAPGRYTLTSHGPEGVQAESGVVVIR